MSESQSDSVELFVFESHEAVTSRPRYRGTLDPAQHALKRIVGQYDFPRSLAWPCGLQGCRTPHQTGFVVETTDGYETNIGHICGKNHFGAAAWDRTRSEYKKNRDDQERAQWLAAMFGEKDALLSDVARLTTSITVAKKRIDDMLENMAKDPNLERSFRNAIKAQVVEVYRPTTNTSEVIGRLAGTEAAEHDFLAKALRNLTSRAMTRLRWLDREELELLDAKGRKERQAELADIRTAIDQGQRALASTSKFLTPHNLRLLGQLDVPRLNNRAARFLGRLRGTAK